MPVSKADLEQVAREIRMDVIRMSHRAGTPHLGSSLSCVDILVGAYWGAARIDPSRPDDPLRDRFILSKGHAAPALYAVLARRGFFPASWLEEFAREGAALAEQPAPECAPGVGMALAAKVQNRDYRVYVCLSDGECNEGSVWEAAMFAPAHQLERLAVIVDYNKWQATGRTNEVMAMEDLRAKWTAFGWSARDVDGHDVASIAEALNKVPDGSGRPVALIAHTVKGKGVSFMEDDNNWHYRIPTAEEVSEAARQLGIPA
jgi:transketolase